MSRAENCGPASPSTQRQYLRLSERLATADAAVQQYIDVYYVEALMWNLDDKTKKWGWSLVPANLKKLYLAMWREP